MQPKSVDRIPEGIQIVWQDGHLSPYSSEFLRQICPCAVCKGHPGDQVEPLAPLPKGSVRILSAKPMGWYALQFIFSDQHDTGIYPYELLRKKCPCGECRGTPSPPVGEG